MTSIGWFIYCTTTTTTSFITTTTTITAGLWVYVYSKLLNTGVILWRLLAGLFTVLLLPPPLLLLLLLLLLLYKF
jgi:hypothetical protein